MTFYMTTAPVRVMRRAQAAHRLALNIRDAEDAYELTALVPGLTAEDLTIQVLEDVVSIEGEFRAADEGETLLNELPRGAFRRAVRLPSQLDANSAEAHIENGVLTLRIAKAESARPKTIKVMAR